MCTRATRPSAGAGRAEPVGRATLVGIMRIAVLSDIHANLVALDAVLDALGPVNAIWHLGDVVGYGPEPNAVVDRLRGLGAVGVRGNHDAAALGGPEIDWFNVDARRAMEWTRTAISPETHAWLAALPERLVIAPFTLVHGSPRDPVWEYVTTTPVARVNLDALDTPYGLHGHTHVPFVFRADDGRIDPLIPTAGWSLALDVRPVLLNPGSVGQPRDGDPRASALVLDTERLSATWSRVAYDFAATQRQMRLVDLPTRLVERLEGGR
jgi:predicted phosphodiesterase